MALTNDKPKEAINIYQLLYIIAQGLDDLTSDPDALKKGVEAAYGLPEAEQKKAEEARASIAAYESLIAENKTQQSVLEKTAKELDAKKAQNDAVLLSISNANQEADKKKKDLDEQLANLNQQTKTLMIANQELQDGREKLNQAENDLAARKKSVADYESSLRITAAQFKGLAEEL